MPPNSAQFSRGNAGLPEPMADDLGAIGAATIGMFGGPAQDAAFIRICHIRVAAKIFWRCPVRGDNVAQLSCKHDAAHETEVAIMKIWYALPVVAIVAALSTPAFADMTVKSEDGTLELALPNGWHEGKAEGPSSKLVALDGRGSRVVVRVYPKDDFKDAKTVANFTVEKLKLLDNDGAKPEDVKVNGHPAIRLNLKGTQSSGMRAGFVITVFENNGMYFEVMGRASAADFEKQAQVLTGFADQLKITPAAGEANNEAAKPETGAKRKLPAPK